MLLLYTLGLGVILLVLLIAAFIVLYLIFTGK